MIGAKVNMGRHWMRMKRGCSSVRAVSKRSIIQAKGNEVAKARIKPPHISFNVTIEWNQKRSRISHKVKRILDGAGKTNRRVEKKCEEASQMAKITKQQKKESKNFLTFGMLEKFYRSRLEESTIKKIFNFVHCQ